MYFWLKLAIQGALELANEYVDSTNIKPGIKTALDDLITAGENALAAIQSGV